MNKPNHFRREFEKVVEKGQGLYENKFTNPKPEVFMDVLFSNVTPQGTKSFIDRLKKLAAHVGDTELLAAYLVEFEAAKTEALNEVRLEKEAKAARAAARTEKAKAVTPNGIALGPVSKGDYEALAALLADLRATYIKKLVSTHLDSVAALRKSMEKVNYTVKDLSHMGWRVSLFERVRGLTHSVILKANAEEIAAEIGRKSGEAEFDGYVVKLAAKIGKTAIAAVITGDLWSHSFLRIETADDEQTWKTQSIINRSPLGNYFHQWPTTLVSKTAKVPA